VVLRRVTRGASASSLKTYARVHTEAAAMLIVSSIAVLTRLMVPRSRGLDSRSRDKLRSFPQLPRRTALGACTESRGEQSQAVGAGWTANL